MPGRSRGLWEAATQRVPEEMAGMKELSPILTREEEEEVLKMLDCKLARWWEAPESRKSEDVSRGGNVAARAEAETAVEM